MLTIDQMRDVLAQCQFPVLKLEIKGDDRVVYLQVSDETGVCNVTGEALPWHGRKWLLSRFMTRSEIVQTAFKAILTALEHEAREQFTYKGVAVLDPHLDVDHMVYVHAHSGLPLSVRPEISKSMGA